MSDAELNLRDSLAEILNAGDPFAKVASADAQLEDITEELFAEETEVDSETEDQETLVAIQEEAPVEASVEIVEKVASDMAMRDVVTDENFKKGFSDIFNSRSFEIEDAVEKIAMDCMEANQD